MILRTITLTVSAAAVLAAAPLAAPAEDAASYPTKAIRLIVPTVPGVPPDTLARILGEKLTSALGQPVVIENRPGAIGTIGLNAVARATPDGYTVGAISMPFIVAPSVLPHVPYDTEKDLAPVALIAWNYGLVTVSATSPVKDIPELVARARANPGALKFGSAGNATPSHLAGELFNREVGVSLTHIPYKGPAVMTGVIRGEVDFYVGSPSTIAPQLRSGRLRALATTAPQRLAAYPDLPTLVELGYPGIVLSDWQGLVVPAGTPGEIIGRLQSEILKMLAEQAFRERLEALGMSAAGLSAEEFARHIHNELRRWDKVVRDAKIRAE